MAGSTGAQGFSHNTRLSASAAMKKESASAGSMRSNSGDSSSCLTGSSPRSSKKSASSGGRAKRERSPDQNFDPSGKGDHDAEHLKGKRRFVGVRQRPSGRWVSEIKDTTQKIRLWLGTFDTAEDAARAYDEAAWLIRGANTRTNFVAAPSKDDNSALPSKAARLLLLRKNAMAAAAANGKSGSGDDSTSKKSPQQKIHTLSESLLARASAAAEPQRATPLSIPFLPVPAAGPMSCTKSFHHQQAKTYSGTPVMSSPPCSSSSVLNSDLSYHGGDMVGFDSNRSATREGGSVFSSSGMDLKVFPATRSPSVTIATGMVGEEEIKPRVGLSSGNDNSCRGIPMAEEMCSSEMSMHRTRAVNRDTVREMSYDNYNDASVRETSRDDNSAAGFQVQQSSPTQQDLNSSTPLTHQDSFDTDISSALSGLEDVDLGCVDSDFDFAAEMSAMASADNDNRINFDSLFNGFASASGSGPPGAGSSGEAASYEEPLTPSEEMRQMMFGRQITAGLYAMNGVQECLMLYNKSTPAPYCMSSPSLSLPPSFAKSHSPFKSGSMSQGWIQQPSLKHEPGESTTNMGGNLVSPTTGLINSNMFSVSRTLSSGQQSDYRSTTNVAEQLIHGSGELSQQFNVGPEGPSPEALWNSWDLPPLCPVI